MGISKQQAHPDYPEMVHARLKGHRLCRVLGERSKGALICGDSRIGISQRPIQ